MTWIQLRGGPTARKFFQRDLHVCLPLSSIVPWSFTVCRGRRGRPPLRKDKPTSAVEHPSSKGTTNDAKRPLPSPEPESPSKRKRTSSSRGRTGIRSTQRVRRVSHTPVSSCIVPVGDKCLTSLQVPDSQSEGEQMLVEPSSSPKLGTFMTCRIPTAPS